MPRDLKEVISLLERDVASTIGESHRAVVASVAEDVRELAVTNEAEQVVADVQQYFHDARVDAVWPRCPRHARHPLWYRNGSWWCVEDGVAVARLGELEQMARADGG